MKTNDNKSDLYPICLSSEDSIDIKRLFPYKWVQSTWKYLGVRIPLELRDLYKVNFTKVYKKIKQRLNDLQTQTFYWIDRINVIKTFLVPKFIFLFRMLPLYVPPSDLNQWQKTLNDFIWDKKMHRISFRVLRQTTKNGGLGIPDLKCYYEAANLTTII